MNRYECLSIGINTDHILKAMKSSRRNGCVGPFAIVPKVVMQYCSPGITVLNFGAGKPDNDGMFLHSEWIRQTGAVVTEYDFGMPIPKSTFDIVFASNVLNVQSDLNMLRNTLYQIQLFCTDGTCVVMNYPKKPRYSCLSKQDVTKHIIDIFNKPIQESPGDVFTLFL